MKSGRTILFLSFILILFLSVKFISEVSAGDLKEADVLMYEYKTYLHKGDFEQAVLSAEKAESVYRKLGYREKQIEALTKLSKAYGKLGFYSNGEKHLKKALNIAESIDNIEYKALVLSKLGALYLTTGNLNKAGSLLNKALALREDSKSITAALYNDIGNFYLVKKMYKKAETSYIKCINTAVKERDKNLLSRAWLNRGALFLLKGKYKESEAAVKTFLKISNDLPPSHDKAMGAIRAAGLYQKIASSGEHTDFKGDEASYNALTTALSTATETDDSRAASYALGYLGGLYERRGRLEEALYFTRMAVFEAQKINIPESLFLWQWRKGRIFKMLGERDKAIMEFKKAAYTLETIHREMTGGCELCITSIFREFVAPVYYGLADMLLEQAKSEDDDEDMQSYLIEAIETMETLKTAEIRDYFNDPCVDAYQAKSKRLEAVSDNMAVIYIIPLYNRTELLVSTSGGIKRFSSDADIVTLSKEAKRFRQKLEKRTTRQYMSHAKRLYDRIMRPIEETLLSESIETLIFVPDRSLRAVPMSALHNGREFLIANYSVVTVQGLTLVNPRKIDRNRASVLLSGITESVQGFPALPNVSSELMAIDRLFRSTIIKDSEFSTKRVEKELGEKQYSIVHIASHGEFKGESGDSYLLAWDDRLTMDRLSDLIKTGKFKERGVELLTLSACQTAAGDDRAALGLAGVAIKAGAGSALASLWYVSDIASTELITEFYSQLQSPNISKAKAIQKAQLKLINHTPFNHPGYWAPFLLIGNWL